MFTNQKFLGLIIIFLVIGASIYIGVTKFKQEISSVSVSPSPSPSGLNFLLNQSPAPTAQSGSGQPAKSNVLQIKSSGNSQSNQAVPVPSELPLKNNKRLSQFPGILTDESLQNKKAVIQTNKGTIQIQIFPETKLASSNFMILTANGFYDGLRFHRVEQGFVIQGGDPNGDGSGGPGYQFSDEPVTREYKKGTVAMANAGVNTNGSQFFILLEDHPELPKNYTIFGSVISGMDIVEKVQPGDVMEKVVIQNL